MAVDFFIKDPSAEIMIMDSTEKPKSQPTLNTEAPEYKIETEHLLFRRMLGSDCDALHEIFSNHDAMTYWCVIMFRPLNCINYMHVLKLMLP